MKFIIGTSGYSYRDWLGALYPTRTQPKEMFGYYVQSFPTVEINYTFYRMPGGDTLAKLCRTSPDGFDFWIKAYRGITHDYDPAFIAPFVDEMTPLRQARKLGGILLQFPQSFHRNLRARKFLDTVIGAFAGLPLAVEFRHRSWQHAAVDAGLAERNVSLVVPDVPPIPNLYICPPTATTRTAYLRLHSRNAENWYESGADRYDYDYSDRELRDLAQRWSALDSEVDKVYAFFNNCHSGKAAKNAQAFRRIVDAMNL